ncbi:MAG: methylated-DNA--[protein]-cysteine S-methyltransferase [Actinomycetota bacterium]
MVTIWAEELEWLGAVTVACGPSGLVAVSLGPAAEAAKRLSQQLPQPAVMRRSELAEETLRQLREYSGGLRTEFHLPLSFLGTQFQCDVWRAVSEIPYGETRTYTQVAALVGRPRAVRAEGAANGANPLCVVVPCHRVIGVNGSLRGYAYGLPLKQRLLELEALVSDRLPVA